MQKPIRKYEWYIGIDVGVHTGFAIWNSNVSQFQSIRTAAIDLTMQWAGFWNKIMDGNGQCNVFFRVEDARLAVHGRQGDRHKLRGAGSVMRDAKMWDDFLHRIGANYEMVRPNPKITKLPEDIFIRTTGWMEPCSSHARDAAMLVYGY